MSADVPPAPAGPRPDDSDAAASDAAAPHAGASDAAAPDGGAVRDDPEAYIARDRRWALATRSSMPDRVRGAGLFADISGFTPLTEALANELGSERGSEELTANLDRVFHAVIAEVDAFGGDVIYFSGDAITCWLDGDDGLRATAAALAIQEAMDRVGTIVTPNGTTVRLAVKVAVAVGAARRFVVGDPTIQLIDVLAGRLVDDLADAEHHADKGDVVLDPSAVGSLGDRVRLREERTDEESRRSFGVVEALTVAVERQPSAEPPTLEDEFVRPWLLPAVWDRIRTGRGEFLAELRPAYPVFLRFGGIDYDDDDEAIEKLDAFVQRAQQIMAGFGGNVLQLTLGDKGAYLYGVFGSPTAHEDDAARAAAATLELRDLERTSDVTGIQIGIGHGRLRSGTYGHRMRRTFVCLGDAVNLAARLMSKAPEGSIYVSDDVRAAAGDAYLWEDLPDLILKGKAAPVVAHGLTGSLERASRRKLRFELPLIGRAAELDVLEAALTEAIGGQSRIVGIAAEAGMGKSRLVAEFVRSARRRGLFVGFGECQSFGATTPYLVWREIWRRLLRVDDAMADEQQVAQIEAELQTVDHGLVARAPLLGGLLGIEIPDNDLTTAFDAKLRKSSLEDLLGEVLQARASGEPIVLVLEDCHWIDELSRDLLGALARVAAGLPILIVLAYRPAGEPGGGLGLERLAAFTETPLDHLDVAEAAALIASKLRQTVGEESEPSPALVGLVTERSGGNPFYIEELISFLAGRGIDLTDERAVRNVDLPESLHSLILSRIDTVGEEPRRTLKVASVVGRVFEAPVLPGAYPELGELGTVRDHLGRLREADLVNLDREAQQAWMFKHIATQEVAYESLPFAVRAMLHGRVGEYIERTAGDGVDQQLDLLAHHYWNSDDQAKKVEYLGRAALAAQASYANTAAIDYFERLVPLLDGPGRIEQMIELAKVHHVVGDIPRAEAILTDARERAAGDIGLTARCDHLLAESARRMGRFGEAADILQLAYAAFVEVGDEAGAGDVSQVSGTVAAQRGDVALARDRYRECLAIRERLGDIPGVAAITNNLGIVAQQQGDASAARAYAERALQLYTELGDRRRIGICNVNLAWMDGIAGDHESERKRCEEAIRLAVEVGDRLNAAIAQNNLGDALRDLGRLHEAGEAYAAAAETYRLLGDLGPLMALLEDVAVLSSRAGRHAVAFVLLGSADALRESLGSPRSTDAETELSAKLREAREALGETAADEERRRGTTLSVDEAVDLTLASAGSSGDAIGPTPP
jgi:class 3 adenylate cyclase/tetratricopeptide (TPR) repeat protein